MNGLLANVGDRMKIRRSTPVWAGWALGVAGILLTLVVPAATPAQKASQTAEPAVPGGPATFRRLSEAQYKRSIEDIFGAGITVPGRFDPALREEGLLAIGDGKVAISASGFEQYELRARQISAKILSEGKRKDYLSCAPSSPQTFDQQCATSFFTKYGRLLYRRPLTQAELAGVMSLASTASAKSQNFYKGLEVGLARMLASPNFIFRFEEGVADRAHPGGRRLDDYSLATRISFLLWDAPPDTELLDAAASGALRQESGLQKQVDRLIASPRFITGTRAFFSDMFGYNQFDGLSKEQAIFPKYTSQLAKDAQEQALRTIVDLLITNNGDYRDLFTTRKTFVNRNLGSLYKVKVDPEIVGGGWMPYTFDADDQRAGILTLAAFLMLDPSHEGRSSPTIRGKSVRELFLCEEIPPPPGNVDFSLVNNAKDMARPTARARLTKHAEDPVCAGCHALTDPLGLAMENYDAIGSFRTVENGAKIDASGKFEDASYRNLLDLTKILRDSPAVSNCAVQRAYEYGVGRPLGESEAAWLEYASKSFANDKYSFPALMRQIATSKAFQTVAADKPLPTTRAKKIASSK